MSRSICLAAAALLGGCAGTSSSNPVATAGQGEVILICEVKQGVDEAAIVPAANALATMPGVLDVTAATGLVATEPNPNAAGASLRRRVDFVITLNDANAAKRASGDWASALKDAGYMDKIDRVIASPGTLQNYQVSQTFKRETTAADLDRRSAAIKQQNELRQHTK